MIPYASRTGTRDNLAAMREHGFRILVSATGPHRHEGFPYGLDNGAWTAHNQGVPWDEQRFVRLVDAMGADADWLVVPDVVADRDGTLAAIRRWLPYCLERCPRVLLAVQDGMTPRDLAPFLSRRVGVAIGGSDGWKEEQLHARAWPTDVWLHALRVNTRRRIQLAAWAGCHSFDGRSASMYHKNAAPIARWTRAATSQRRLF